MSANALFIGGVACGVVGIVGMAIMLRKAGWL